MLGRCGAPTAASGQCVTEGGVPSWCSGDGAGGHWDYRYTSTLIEPSIDPHETLSLHLFPGFPYNVTASASVVEVSFIYRPVKYLITLFQNNTSLGDLLNFNWKGMVHTHTPPDKQWQGGALLWKGIELNHK